MTIWRQTDFDSLDVCATLSAQADDGNKDQVVPLYVASCVAATTLRDRSVAFTPQDDMEVRTVMGRANASGAGLTLTLTVTVDSGDTTFLVDNTVSAAGTSVGAGSLDVRGDFRTTTGTRVRLLKGVRYRFAVSSSGNTLTLITAALQLRTRRRRSPIGAGAVPALPWQMIDAANADVDKINDNLEAMARAVRRNQDARYTPGIAIYPLTGMADTDDASLRKVYLRRPASGRCVEVVGYEVVLYGEAADWTVACSVSGVPDLVVTTSGDTVEAVGSLGVGFTIGSESSDTTLTLTASAASSLAGGYVVVHTRTDRWKQGDTKTEYEPTPLLATTAQTHTALNAQIAALAAAVAADAAGDADLRCTCYVARGVAAGSSVAHRIQSGLIRGTRLRGYIVAAAGCNAAFTVGSTGSFTVNGAGATTLATGEDSTFTDTPNDDPTDSTDDITVTLAATGAGTALLLVLFVWWD